MTVAPHRSPQTRFRLILAFVVLDLVIAVVVLREFGVGPSIILWALAGVGIVNLLVLQRGGEQRTPSRRLE